MTAGPVRLADALEDAVAELVAAWPPLTPARRDRIAALLRPQPHTPAPGPSSPVASAGTASRGLSAGARPHDAAATPHLPAQRSARALPRPAFRAIPEASS
ncbi:hypothetical protein [Actinomycetospora flava]|uniref:Uncharacterized protein n=1 Tax=Actinomycetospora flava TaxID=3129232 RepID=A0ABU8M0H8_9PSEU